MMRCINYVNHSNHLSISDDYTTSHIIPSHHRMIPVHTYLVLDQRLAQVSFVRVDQQGAVVVRIGLTQFRCRARYLGKSGERDKMYI